MNDYKNLLHRFKEKTSILLNDVIWFCKNNVLKKSLRNSAGIF